MRAFPKPKLPTASINSVNYYPTPGFQLALHIYGLPTPEMRDMRKPYGYRTAGPNYSGS